MCVSPREHQPQTWPFHCCMPVEDPLAPTPQKKTSLRRNKKPRMEKIYGVFRGQGRADFFIIVFKLNFSLVQIPPRPGLMAFAGKRGAEIKSPFLGLPPAASGPACAGTGSPPGAGILLAALYLEHSSCEPVSPTPPAAWFSVF